VRIVVHVLALVGWWFAFVTFVLFVGVMVAGLSGGVAHGFAWVDVSVWNRTNVPLVVTITNRHIPPEGEHARFGLFETFIPATTEPELIPPGALRVIGLLTALKVDDPEVHLEVRARNGLARHRHVIVC